jgi:tight adherence protein B
MIDLSQISEIHIFYALLVLAAILLAEAIYLGFSKNTDKQKIINRRMRIHSKTNDGEAILIQLRKERGMSQSGELQLSFAWFNKLIIQSGLSIGVTKPIILSAFTAFFIACTVFYFRKSFIEFPIVFVISFIGLPLFILNMMRSKRQKLFGIQLPEAIELITRSLKAGHPVPVAFSVVAREMPDPIGTEFGLVSDEVTYGSDFVTALKKMDTRVGQDDLPLFVTAVAIQNSTGGNLREILDSLADVIRQRIKMRRKVKAISSEGRMSALILTAMPVGLFLIVNMMQPDFYGEIWHLKETKYGLAGGITWLVLGNLMMFKMVNFKV